MKKALENKLAGLSPERMKALLGKLHKDPGVKRETLEKTPGIPGHYYPLSSAQERLWFLCQLAPDNPAFSNPGAFRAKLDADLDCVLLEQALNLMGQRHQMLRTTFHSKNGKPAQLLHGEMPLTVLYEDIRGLPQDQAEEVSQRIAINEGRRVFNLETGPLISLKLLHVREHEYLLLVNSHHIISDGWSNSMFAKELSAIYKDLAGGVKPQLATLPYQYMDYVNWERKWMACDQQQKQMAYWKGKLNPPPEPLNLPTDHPRPKSMSYRGAMVTQQVPDPLGDRLREFARSEGASLFQLLIAGFKTLLYRYTGQNDMAVGSSTANRNQREFQGVMGLFINTLVFRTEIAENQTFRSYLAQVRQTCREALSHQQLPFEKLIGELNPHRTLNVNPLFQVMFVHQNVPAMYEVPGMRIELYKVDYQTSKFDLNLWVEEMNGQIFLTLHYNNDLFNASTMSRMLQHYESLLTAVADNPQVPIDEIAYFENHPTPLQEEWEPPQATFLEEFETVVARLPNQPAVECNGARMTYSRLNAEANQLARHLVEKAGDKPIALLMDRNLSMIVGLLGIMKTGRPYLPIEPGLPEARIKLMLEQSGARVLATERLFRPLAESLPAEPVYLDTDWPLISQQSKENPGMKIRQSDLAYIMFTSGTTGSPKGVCVEHRNLANYCAAVWLKMGCGPGDRFATVSSLAADLGNTMIFPALARGGCVVVIPGFMNTSAAQLLKYLQHNPIDALKITPSHLHALLKARPEPQLLPKKRLVLGGEASSPELIKTIWKLKPNCRILNHYGPTETTIGVAAHEVTPEDTDLIPLGQAMPGSHVAILDKNMRPMPHGLTGQIYISGAGVSRGYLNQPELTAQRFKTGPNGERYYATGDLGKRLPNGNLVFLGRMDRQIKVRGFRVELGEIEENLKKISGIDQAVVTPPQPDDPRQRLTAYLQVNKAYIIDPSTVRHCLSCFLPAHMVPDVYHLLDAMPLTPNGKIDYKTLALKETRETEMSGAPRDQLELELAILWKDLLGASGFSIHDNFFQVGGHSLLGVQLMSHIHRKYGLDLPLASLFEHGSIKQLAALIKQDAPLARSSPLVPITREGHGPPMYFVHPAGGNVLCYYELAQNLKSGPVFGLQSLGDGHDITQMAKAYRAALPEPPEGHPMVFGGWSMGALAAFEMGRQYRGKGPWPVIAILDQMAPGVQMAKDQDDLSLLLSFSVKVSRLVGRDLGLTQNQLAQASPEEQAALFLEKFHMAQLVPQNTSLSDFRGFLDLMLAHNRATAQYNPKPYPGKLLVFRAQAPADLDPELSKALGLSAKREPDLGWGKYSEQEVTVIPTPGNHVSMMTGSNIRALAQKLDEQLKSIKPKESLP